MEPKDPIKQPILDAALAMMNQSGFGSLNLSELARRSKITRQRLFYHFPDIEEVLIILTKQWSLSGQQWTILALAETEEVRAMKVLAVSQGMFDWMREDRELSRLGLVIFQTSPHIKKLNSFVKDARNTARERIRSLLIQEITFADMKKQQLEKVITAIHSMLYGFFLYVVSMNDFDNLKEHESNCNEALRSLILSHLKLR